MSTMFRARLCLTAAALLTATACGDEQAASLIGSWRQTTPGATYLFQFNSDSTVVFDSLAQDGTSLEHQTGRYTAVDQQLSLDVKDAGGARQVLKTEYYVSGDAFYLSPLLPTGEHSGIVGTWNGSISFSAYDASGRATTQNNVALTLNLLADGSASGTYSSTSQLTLSGGSWRNDTTTTVSGYIISFPTASFIFQLVDDAALGQRPYMRIP